MLSAQEATEPSAPPTLTETPSLTPTFTETATLLPSETARASATVTEPATLPVIQTLPAEVTAEPSPEITAEVTPEVTIESTAEVTAEATEALPPTETATAAATGEPLPYPVAARTDVIAPDDLSIAFQRRFDSSPPDFSGLQVNSTWQSVTTGQMPVLALAGGTDPLVLTNPDWQNLLVTIRFQHSSEAVQIELRQMEQPAYRAVLDPSGVLLLYRDLEQIAAQYTGPQVEGAWYTLGLTAYYDMLHVTLNGSIVLAISDGFRLPGSTIVIGGGRTLAHLLLLDAVMVQTQMLPATGASVQSNSFLLQAEAQTANDTLELIDAIQNCSGPMTIDLVPNQVYSISGTPAYPHISGASGLPVIACDITLNGNGATIRRDSTASFRLFTVAAGASLTLNQLVIENGNSANSGGAIYSYGNLTLDAVIVQNNHARTAGGIIQFAATLIIRNGSNIRNNQTDSGGGAGIIISTDAVAAIEDTYILNNSVNSPYAHTCCNAGGGLAALDNSDVTLNYVTVQGNHAGIYGGGLFARDTSQLKVTHTALQDNSTDLANFTGATGNAIYLQANSYIHTSCFLNNSGGLYDVDAAAASSATDNWWGTGTPSVLSGETDIGETINPNIVNYIPFSSTMPDCGSRILLPSIGLASLLIEFAPNFFVERTLEACTANYPGQQRTHCWVHVSVLNLIGTLDSYNITFTHQALIEALIESEYRSASDITGISSWGNEAVARQFYGACGTDGCQGEELYSFLDYFQASLAGKLDDFYNRAQENRFDPRPYFQGLYTQLQNLVNGVLTPADPLWLNGVVTREPYGFGTRGYQTLVDVSAIAVAQYTQLCGFAAVVESNGANPPLGQMFVGTTPATDPALGGSCSINN